MLTSNDVITGLTLTGCLITLALKGRSLQRSDYFLALAVGLLVGVGMLFATLFNPYPFLGLVHSNPGQALARGVVTTIAMLGGLVCMRLNGPVRVQSAAGEWHKAAISLGIGVAVGLPFAIVNFFALQLTQGRPVTWQNPLAALLDAWQPAIVEEVVYRFALLGLLWVLLRKPFPRQASWLAAGLALLAHNFMHFDSLWQQNPLAALGMGVVMAILWGLPPTILALRRDLEAAIGFHWIQDVLRFLAGY